VSLSRRSRAPPPGAVVAGVVTALVVAGSPAPASASASAKGTGHHTHRSRHVLLLSVDGLHQSDLARYVSQHHHSALAALVKHGTGFTHARTPFPSDSCPVVAEGTRGPPLR